MTEDPTALRELLVRRFSEDELRDLCFELGIDYNDLGGTGRKGHARELVAHFQRHERLEELAAAIQRLRPDIGQAGASESETTTGKTAQTPRIEQAAAQPEAAKIRILFLGANPANSTRLRLDAEVRAIDEALRKSEFRHRFELIQHWAVRPTDLQELLLRHQPHIVHFSGHGSAHYQIVLEDANGQAVAVSAQALEMLFGVLKDRVRCVVLNACYAEGQARAIAKHIDAVIGMSQAISDMASLAFAAAFYQALGFGRDLQTAFELGRAQIALLGLEEQDTPRLVVLRAQPQTIVFA